MRKKKVKALSLLSGGLDSLLAVKVLQDQGIEVVGISFTTPFFSAENAKKGAAELGIKLIVENITNPHMKLVKDPPRGHGKYMNPCIDCHTLMINIAGKLMEKKGFDLIATGEVLGERPMSQNYSSLMGVANRSGYGEYLLRPLSAKLLPEIKPEKEGLVDRSRLMNIQGRSRKPQIKLAKKYGIKSYVQPAGGCLLTDPGFSKRLKDLFYHSKKFSVRDVELLKLGRHFRLNKETKVIVGRNELENRQIEDLASSSDVLIISSSVPGPSSLVLGKVTHVEIEKASALTASFAKAKGKPVEMELIVKGKKKNVCAKPSDKEHWNKLRL